MAKPRDIDFLFVSAQVRGKEVRLLTQEQIERMIAAVDEREIVRILEEAHYEQVDLRDPYQLDVAVQKRQATIFKELAAHSPSPEIVDIFRLPYDYHNAKVLIKSEAADVDGEHLMSDNGRVHHSVFAEVFHDGPLPGIPQILAKALLAAKAVLTEMGDAQAADILLDRAMYQEYLVLAERLGDDFFLSYVRLLIDKANLTTLVRLRRMKTSSLQAADVLIDGGHVSVRVLVDAMELGKRLDTLYTGLPLEAASVSGQVASEGGDLTVFERLSDHAVSAYLQARRQVSFGVAPVVAYLAAIEAEGQTVRTIAASRMAGLDADQVRERLRGTYA